MTDRSQIFARIVELIEPFNEKGVTLGEDISFARDLELDSLKVMDLVASIEDEWDITLPLNMLPELETIGQLADAVAKLAKRSEERRGGKECVSTGKSLWVPYH